MSNVEKVVVVGAGQATAALVAKLRMSGFEGQITVVGDEQDLPYQRPPLSKAYLLGELPRERLYLRPDDYYAKNTIDMRLSTRATKIDRAAKELHLENGETLPYDALVLATGATPRRLPAAMGGALAGVLTMRDLSDADHMAPYLKEGASAVIIGGGYIGLEAAAVCAKRGLKVTLIEAAPRILGRVAGAPTAAYFRSLHQSHGVEILEGVGIEALLGEDHVRAVRLADGREIAADFVLTGIGVQPNDLLAREAGLATEGGIHVDGFSRTEDSAIYAAGDCAAIFHQERRMRIESVSNAIDQGENVALNILGQEKLYQPKPWFWSDQYDCKLQIAGLGAFDDEIIQRPGEKEGSVSHWYFRADRLVAIDAMNDGRAYMVGKRLIDAGKTVDKALVADTSIELKALLG